MFNSAAVAVTATPPTSQLPAVRFGAMAVVPSSRSSMLSKLSFRDWPHVFSSPPIVGFVRLYVVVVAIYWFLVLSRSVPLERAASLAMLSRIVAAA
jgi:hypothetical protein